MLRKIRLTLLFFSLLFPAVAAASPIDEADETKMAATLLKHKLLKQKLVDQKGEAHKLLPAKNKKAIVVFTHGIGCPIVRHMAKDFEAVSQRYASEGFDFYMLNANLQDSVAKILSDTKEFAINLPVLKDDSQEIAKTLGLTRTAETIIISPDDGKIIYRGTVNDRVSYETVKKEAKNHYLVKALDEISANKPVSQAEVRFVGCAISYL